LRKEATIAGIDELSAVVQFVVAKKLLKSRREKGVASLTK